MLLIPEMCPRQGQQTKIAIAQDVESQLGKAAFHGLGKLLCDSRAMHRRHLVFRFAKSSYAKASEGTRFSKLAARAKKN